MLQGHIWSEVQILVDPKPLQVTLSSKRYSIAISSLKALIQVGKGNLKNVYSNRNLYKVFSYISDNHTNDFLPLAVGVIRISFRLIKNRKSLGLY